jgi:hypothetical protein
MIWIIVILSVLLLSSIIGSILLAIAIRRSEKKLDIYEQWVVEYQNMLRDTYIKLKNVDDRNLFEKDDDVGFVFQSILQIVDEIDKRSNNSI